MEPSYRASPEVILTELRDGTGVLLHLGTKFYYDINATGVAAWSALSAQTGTTRQVLAERLAQRFRVNRDTVRRDLEPVLREMLVEGLVTSD